MIRRLALAAAVIPALTLPALTLSGPATAADPDRARIEAIVREYLISHPEVLVEAMNALQAREEAKAEVQQRQTLTTRKQELLASPDTPVAGNPQGDVSMVEFFDYQCGYCKAAQPDIDRLVKGDGRLRLVLKEFPILGPASVTASRAALASRGQGKYLEFHDALMAHRGQLDDDRIFKIAATLGLDIDRLKKDMQAPAVEAVIATNTRLAQDLNIRGTPAFIIGDQVVPGVVSLDKMKQIVSTARSGG